MSTFSRVYPYTDDFDETTSTMFDYLVIDNWILRAIKIPRDITVIRSSYDNFLVVLREDLIKVLRNFISKIDKHDDIDDLLDDLLAKYMVDRLIKSLHYYIKSELVAIRPIVRYHLIDLTYIISLSDFNFLVEEYVNIKHEFLEKVNIRLIENTDLYPITVDIDNAKVIRDIVNTKNPYEKYVKLWIAAEKYSPFIKTAKIQNRAMSRVIIGIRSLNNISKDKCLEFMRNINRELYKRLIKSLISNEKIKFRV